MYVLIAKFLIIFRLFFKTKDVKRKKIHLKLPSSLLPVIVQFCSKTDEANFKKSVYMTPPVRRQIEHQRAAKTITSFMKSCKYPEEYVNNHFWSMSSPFEIHIPQPFSKKMWMYIQKRFFGSTIQTSTSNSERLDYFVSKMKKSQSYLRMYRFHLTHTLKIGDEAYEHVMRELYTEYKTMNLNIQMKRNELYQEFQRKPTFYLIHEFVQTMDCEELDHKGI